MQRSTFSPNTAIKREPIVFCLSRSACNTISHRYDEVEQLVLESMDLWLKSYDVPVIQEDTRLAAQLSQTLAAQEKQLAALNMRITRLYDLVETGTYTADVFLQRKDALHEERAALLARTEETRAALTLLEQNRLVQNEYLPRLRDVLQAYPLAENAAEQNRLLKTVIKDIVYTKTERVTPASPGNLKLVVLPLLPPSCAEML